MTREEIILEIDRRRPWYQRVEIPSLGITTTDDPANAMLDAAWDNKIGDITLEEAALQRPVPKWNYIKNFIPALSGATVLEIGSNCGFFSFEFARLGAEKVYGIDVSPHHLSNARWLRSILDYRNVEFLEGDFMKLDFNGDTPQLSPDMLSTDDREIPLCDDKIDIIFMSTVLDHLFFPLFSLYKMIRMARRFVIVDVPVFHWSKENSAAHLSVEPSGSHHGFVFTLEFLVNYTVRLGIPREQIVANMYNESRSMTLVIDTTQKTKMLNGA